MSEEQILALIKSKRDNAVIDFNYHCELLKKLKRATDEFIKCLGEIRELRVTIQTYNDLINEITYQITKPV